MADKIVKFTFRTEEELLKKLRSVAEFYITDAERQKCRKVANAFAELENEAVDLVVADTRGRTVEEAPFGRGI